MSALDELAGPKAYLILEVDSCNQVPICESINVNALEFHTEIKHVVHLNLSKIWIFDSKKKERKKRNSSILTAS